MKNYKLHEYEIPNDAHSFEVFAIKPCSNSPTGKQAFIGYKLNNDDFYFIQVPYTEPDINSSEDINHKCIDIFKKGNRITTNGISCFEVIDSNENSIVCKDLYTDDFMVFSKTEHKFEIADYKSILINSLKEILYETQIKQDDKNHIHSNMYHRINKLL
jgi:hypothetical protein